MSRLERVRQLRWEHGPADVRDGRFGSEQWSLDETNEAEVCVIRSSSGETSAQSSVLAGRGLPLGGEPLESAELERLADDRAVECGERGP